MILGLGSLAVDDLLGVERFPTPGEKMRVVWRRRESGGLVATALAAASRLGAETAWVGTLGEDALSEWALAGLARDGIGAQWVRRAPGAGPHASVVVVETAQGRRTVLSDNGAVPTFAPELVGPEMLEGVQAVLVDHTQVVAGTRLAGLARERGIPVVSDIERVTDGLAELLPLVDHFLCGREFAHALTGEAEPGAMVAALRRRHGTGAACCVVTAGEDGCWYETPSGGGAIPACPVQAVDTTGCGDVFHGAYLAELTRGAQPAAALRFATAAAGWAATQIGGRAGLPTRDAVEEKLSTLPGP